MDGLAFEHGSPGDRTRARLSNVVPFMNSGAGRRKSVAAPRDRSCRPRCGPIATISASHSRAADFDHVSSTVCRSKVERLMTLSTSAVAVCCCKRFAQLVEQARVLDRDDGLIGKILDQLDLLVGEGTDLLAVNRDRPDQIAFP